MFFLLLASLCFAGSLFVVTAANSIHSVLFLVLVFFSSASLFLFMKAEFLALIFLVVYVGAIAVLFLFVVMMLNVAQQKNQWFNSEENSGHIPIGLIISTIIFFELIIVIGGWKFKPELSDSSTTQISNEISNTHLLGQVLYIYRT